MFKAVIVDDEQNTREILLKELQKYSPDHIYEASDGLEAYFIILQNKPEIMVLDMDMPRLNGAMLLERLQNNNIEMQIIVVSGHDDYEYMHSSIKYGVTDYLLKPINRKALNKAVQKAKESIINKKSVDLGLSIRLNNNDFIKDIINEKNNEINAVILHVIAVILKPEGRKGLLAGNQSGTDITENLKCIGGNNPKYFLYFSNASEEKVINNIQKELSSFINCPFTAVLVKSGGRQNDIRRSCILAEKGVRMLNIAAFDFHVHDYYELSESNTAANDDKADKIYTSVALDDLPDSLIEEIKDSKSVTTKQINDQFQKYMELVKSWCDAKGKSSDYIYDCIWSFKQAMNTYDVAEIIKSITLIKEVVRKNTREENTEEDLSMKLKFYIDMNYNNKITLDDLSELFHFSKEHLVRSFKKKYDLSIINYLNGVRLKNAKRFLDSGLSLSVACAKVGFSDINYFSRQFKKEYGIAPSIYLKSKKR